MPNAGQPNSATGNGQPHSAHGVRKDRTTTPVTHTPLRPLLYKACTNGHLRMEGLHSASVQKRVHTRAPVSLLDHTAAPAIHITQGSLSILLPLSPHSSHRLLRHGTPTGTWKLPKHPDLSSAYKRRRRERTHLQLEQNKNFIQVWWRCPKIQKVMINLIKKVS